MEHIYSFPTILPMIVPEEPVIVPMVEHHRHRREGASHADAPSNPADRAADRAQLRARLLRMIVNNEQVRRNDRGSRVS